MTFATDIRYDPMKSNLYLDDFQIVRLTKENKEIDLGDIFMGHHLCCVSDHDRLPISALFKRFLCTDGAMSLQTGNIVTALWARREEFGNCVQRFFAALTKCEQGQRQKRNATHGHET